MPTACPGSGEFVAAQKQGKEQYNPGMCCNVGVYIERHGSIPQKHVEEHENANVLLASRLKF